MPIRKLLGWAMVQTAPFPVRGFHVDLRVQVMKPKALIRLADDIAAVGCNTLVVEWEGCFPYRRNATISHERAYQPAEVRGFLKHCRTLGLNVIPLQQSLGHLEYVLRHPRYAPLREDEDNLCQVCPQKPEAVRQLMRSLLQDLRDYHDGPLIHLGGDEAYLLGHCPACRAYAVKHGHSQLYAEHMSMVIEEAKTLGWRGVVWADMLLKHPERAKLLPKDTIMVDWNYGWARNRFGSPDNLLGRGFEIWGAPALRSAPDNHSLTWWGRHLQNFKEFIPQAARDGYMGIILTSWSTSGLCGYERDGAVGSEVLELLPIRRVYPLNGHRLLLAAFADAVDNQAGFSPEGFLATYAAERFGLGPAARRTFVTALMAQTPQGTPPARRLAALRPVRNHGEFGHLRLIENFRWLQHEGQILSARFNEPGHTRGAAGRLLPSVAELVRRSRRLEADYAECQRDFLPREEIGLDTAYRQKALLRLYETLRNQRA